MIEKTISTEDIMNTTLPQISALEPAETTPALHAVTNSLSGSVLSVDSFEKETSIQMEGSSVQEKVNRNARDLI
jgi:hypothetical protein